MACSDNVRTRQGGSRREKRLGVLDWGARGHVHLLVRVIISMSFLVLDPSKGGDWFIDNMPTGLDAAHTNHVGWESRAVDQCNESGESENWRTPPPRPSPPLGHTTNTRPQPFAAISAYIPLSTRHRHACTCTAPLEASKGT